MMIENLAKRVNNKERRQKIITEYKLQKSKAAYLRHASMCNMVSEVCRLLKDVVGDIAAIENVTR